MQMEYKFQCWGFHSKHNGEMNKWNEQIVIIAFNFIHYYVHVAIPA